VDLAEKHDAPLMTGSSFEYVKEVEIVRQQVRANGQIRGYVADNGAGVRLARDPRPALRVRLRGRRGEAGGPPAAGPGGPNGVA